MRSSTFLAFLLLSGISCSAGDELSKRINDFIYGKCQDVHVGPTTIPNACVNLYTGDNCGLNVSLSIAENQIFSQNIDYLVTPQACGVYENQGYTCNFCVDLQLSEDKTQRCITIEPVCNGIKLQDIDGGCFNESALQNAESCQKTTCPENCYGQGTCDNGICTCNPGFYGEDCGSTDPELYYDCIQFDQLTGDICVHLAFTECQIEVSLKIESGYEEELLYDNHFNVSQVQTLFAEGQCASYGLAYAKCQVCLDWTDLELNDYYAYGCGMLNASCPGMPVYEQQLPCFNDTRVAPTCFSPTCPNDCSGHGTCSFGVCKCRDGYGGDDCNSGKNCPKACSGHGKCTYPNKCVCSNGWAGSGCDIADDASSSSGKPKSGNILVYVLIPVLILIGLGIAGGITWYIRKKRDTSVKFTQLDLVSADDDEGLID